MDALRPYIPNKINRAKISTYNLLRLYAKYYTNNFIDDIIVRARALNERNIQTRQEQQSATSSRWSRFKRWFRRLPTPTIYFGHFQANVYNVNGAPEIYIIDDGNVILEIDTATREYTTAGGQRWLIPTLEKTLTYDEERELRWGNDYFAAERVRLAKRVFMNSYEIIEYLYYANIGCGRYFIAAVAELCTLSEFLGLATSLPEYKLSSNSYTGFLAHALDNGADSHHCGASCGATCVYRDVPDTDMMFQSYDGETIHAHKFIICAYSKMVAGLLENYPDGVVPLPFTGNVIRHAVIAIYMQTIAAVNTLCGLDELEQLLHLLDMMCVINKDVVSQHWIKWLIE